jgi:hypothetical protein
VSKDAEENAPGYDLDPTGTSVLSSNIAKEEKSHIDIQTALNQQACNLTRRIHGEEEEDNTEQWNAEERSSAMEFGHGNRPPYCGNTRKTRGLRLPYPTVVGYQRLTKNFLAFYQRTLKGYIRGILKDVLGKY